MSVETNVKKSNAEKQLSDVEYDIALNKRLKEHLTESQRDVALTSERLDLLKDVISSDADSFKTLFGGSVKKHTYVDGLSDTDVLLIVNDTSLEGKPPEFIKDHIYDVIKSKTIKEIDEIKKGDLAITVRYKDGQEVQILPAVRKGDKFRIPDKDGDWSTLINPEKFARSLIRVNQENGGKVIHTVRLIKSIQSKYPEEERLSGYHIESLAVKIFDKNQTSMSNQERVMHFLDRSKELVKKPIKDSTNQSAFVDKYLGDEGSPQRARVSRALEKTQRDLKNAIEEKDLDLWDAVLEAPK